MKPRPSVCHGPAVTPCQAARTVAPCGAVVRPATPEHPGDGTSSGTRFISCKKCLRLGKRGQFRLVHNRPIEQLALGLGG